MKKFGLVIATVIVMALTGCGNKETAIADDKAVVNVSTEATVEVTTEEVTTEEVVQTTTEEKTEKNDKTTEFVAQTTTVTSVQPTSSQQSSQTTSTPKPAQQTSSQTSTPAPTTTEAPKPSTTQAPAPTTEAPAPVHQHSWTTRTEAVEAAWTETVEHPAVTHTEIHMQCSYCGGFFVDMYAHQDQYLDTNIEHAIAGYHTAAQTIVDQEAWTETIEHPAVTKTVEYCTECGATK